MEIFKFSKATRQNFSYEYYNLISQERNMLQKIVRGKCWGFPLDDA